MKQLSFLQNYIFRFGALAFLFGLGMRLFNPLVGTLFFVAGVVLFTSMQMLAGYEGNNFIIARLRRQQVMGDLALLLSAAAMLAQQFNFGPSWAHRNLWLLLLAIGCILQLYTAFRIPSELEKERKAHPDSPAPRSLDTSKPRDLDNPKNRNLDNSMNRGLDNSTSRNLDNPKPRHLGGGVALILLLPLLLLSCATQYNVEGTTNVSMLEGKTLYLKVFTDEMMKSLDSCTVQHGRIRFNGALDSVQMVNIFMDDQSMMPMVLEEGIISLTIDESRQNVTGSPMNDTLYNFIRAKVKLDNELEDIPALESRLIVDGVEEMERERILMSEVQRISSANDKLVTSFVIRNSDNVLGPGVFMIMTSGYPFPQLTPQIEEILFRAKPSFKEHPYVKRYVEAARKNMEKIHTGASADVMQGDNAVE